MPSYDNKVLTGDQLVYFSSLVKSALASKQDSLVFNTAYNASSNKVATMADIPSAYSLPTATTATLGGVKVDGTTITISDGVISAVGGGTTYTAGAGIDISNGEISFTGVFDDQSDIVFITTYENENTKNETYLGIDGLTIHSYGEPDIETGDQIDIGVDITSSGITFTNPEYGGEYTLSPRLGGLDINNALILTTSACNTAYNASSNKVATMADITSALSGISSFSFEIVQSLPQSNISTSKIYLVAKQTSGTNQVYTEYAYVNNAWEIIGDTSMSIDTLSNAEVATIWNTATASAS